MPEEPQVVSISSSAALSPDEIARKSFPVARRGVDGEAVRVFLGKVAAELRELMEREAVLRTRVMEAERRAEEPELDEATLTRAIGTETAKILWTAHDAAKNVVTTAEERAAELLGQAERVLEEHVTAAEEEARAVREAAEQEIAESMGRAQSEADSLTEIAQADAVELLDATKEECRRMVAEARELRTRTLADLAARRRALHIQLAELRTGKDSLLQVVDGVADSFDQLRERLASAEDVARVAAEEAGNRAAEEGGPVDIAELEAELAAAGEEEEDEEQVAAIEVAAGQAAEQAAQAEEVATASKRSVDELFARIRASRVTEETIYDIEAVNAAEASAAAGGAETGEAGPEGEAAAGEAAEGEAEAGEAGPEQATAEVPVVASGAGDDEEGEPAGTEGGEVEAETDRSGTGEEAEETGATENEGDQAAAEAPPAGDAAEPAGAGEATETPAPVQADAPDITQLIEIVKADGGDGRLENEAITEPDVEALARRDHLLGAITAKLGRTLKRALQDDQNDLLNALRQASGKPALEELSPQNVQLERLVTAAEEPLARAFEAGAAFLVTGDTVEGPAVSAPAPTELVAFEAGTMIAAELAEDLSSQLRQRIEEALAELDGALEGSADAAGSAYREWKGTRVEGLAGDFATSAFAAGELAVLSSLEEGGAPYVRWVVEDDDAGGSCPDCDDNSLAGPQPPGSEFPTGHVRPPVHPGCRCLLVPVRS